MYEYESKKINNYFEVKEVVRRATSYFVGSFMLEILMRRQEWENPETKSAFVENFHNEYFSYDDSWTLSRTRNRLNLVIRIIESRKVEDALEYVINSNHFKMDIPQARENAEITLQLIRAGKVKY